MPHYDLPSDYKLVRTPEAIREDMDRRAAHGIKRPIFVTVTGAKDSGKTTLIAVLAQALENTGHLVSKPKHVPNASRALMDLREQFDITFYEHDGTAASEHEEAPAELSDRERELSYEVATLRAEQENVTREAASLRATIAELNGKVSGLGGDNSRLRRENAALVESNKRFAATDEELRTSIDALNRALEQLATDPDIVSQEVDVAFEAIRQSAGLEIERNRLRAAAQDYRDQADTQAAASEGFAAKARERMMHLYHRATSTDLETARREIDYALSESTSAAVTHAEAHRLRKMANDVRAQAAKVGQEGEARYQKARERLLLCLSGAAWPEKVVEYADYDEPVPAHETPEPCIRTLREMAQSVAGGDLINFDTPASEREAVATERLLAANTALMGFEGHEEGC